MVWLELDCRLNRQDFKNAQELREILAATEIDPTTRVRELTDEEVAKIRTYKK